MSFGKQPVSDYVCINCPATHGVLLSRGGKPQVLPRPVKLHVESHAVYGGADYNRELGKSPNMKMILLPIANVSSRPRKPVSQQDAPNRPLSVRPQPAPGAQLHPVPTRRGTVSSHTAPREEDQYAQYTPSPSRGDDDMSFDGYVAVPFFTRRRFNAISDSDNNLIGESRVYHLTSSNFDEVLKSSEKAFVMFLDSTNESGTCAGKEFYKAAKEEYPYSHALGIVDCSQDQQLCLREDAIKLPIYKLYSNGFDLSTIRNVDKFCAKQIRMLMKLSPVLTKPRTQVAPGLKRR